MVIEMNRYEKSIGVLILFIPAIILWISDSIVYSAEQSSSNYSIVRSVISGGGGDLVSNNYEMQYTIGQSTPIGTSTSSNYDNNAGFWFLEYISADSDGDGVPDEEDDFPDDPNEWLDTDGDGIGNNADTDDDNDLIPDYWEEQYGLDPLLNDALNDLDGDGYTNLQEYRERTNPDNPNDYPFPWEIFYPAFIKKAK